MATLIDSSSRVVARRLRQGLGALALGLFAGSAWAGTLVEVWKDPNCGCCSAWVEHLEAAGFETRTHASHDMAAVKAGHDVPVELASCHTAVIDGYVIEGHVPAADIRRLLETRPDVAGLAVPGMPHGSPGMETGRFDDYAVHAWTDAGETRIVNRYTHG